LTLITEANYVREDAVGAPAYGLAQYGVYTMNTWLSLVGRGEVFGDPNNYFVAAYPGNRTPVQAERGLTLDQPLMAPRTGTTYGEVTIGANITPEGLPALLTGTVIRPELRFDSTLDGVNAYEAGKRASQVSAGIDLVVPFGFF